MTIALMNIGALLFALGGFLIMLKFDDSKTSYAVGALLIALFFLLFSTHYIQ